MCNISVILFEGRHSEQNRQTAKVCTNQHIGYSGLYGCEKEGQRAEKWGSQYCRPSVTVY